MRRGRIDREGIGNTKGGGRARKGEEVTEGRMVWSTDYEYPEPPIVRPMSPFLAMFNY